MEKKRYIDINIYVGENKDIDIVNLILRLATFIDKVGKDNTFLGKINYKEDRYTIYTFDLREE